MAFMSVVFADWFTIFRAACFNQSYWRCCLVSQSEANLRPHTRSKCQGQNVSLHLSLENKF